MRRMKKEAKRKWVLERLDAGRSISDIAVELGVSRQAISRYVKVVLGLLYAEVHKKAQLKATDEEIWKAIESGIGRQAAAKHFGVQLPILNEELKRRGIVWRKWHRRNLQIAEDYLKGDLTYQEIAQKYNCSIGNVINTLNRYNIAKNRQGSFIPKYRTVIDEYLKTDLEVIEIADRHGMSVGNVYRILCQYGFTSYRKVRQTGHPTDQYEQRYQELYGDRL